MGEEKRLPLMKAGSIIALLLGMSMLIPAVAKAQAVLQNTDCIKCHQKQPATIEKNGGKHKTKVTCLDCHLEHPPWGKNAIPKCSNCHTGKSHFQLDNCLQCHSDPHEPLALKLADNVKEACYTCHAQQGKEFTEGPSKHSARSCTFCHPTHGLIPECAQCHKPHVSGQNTPDCLGCHPVHHPKDIMIAESAPSNYCSACHGKVVTLLSQTKTKHGALACAFCHKGQHPTVPKCQGCHGEPHSPAMHKTVPRCLDCHLDPHNLKK